MQNLPKPALPAKNDAPVTLPRREGAWHERDGFATLYGEFGPRLFRFCLRLTGGKTAEAEDLAQDVFVAAYQKPDWAGRASLSTWLFKIAVFRWQAQNRRPTMDAITEIHEQTLPMPGARLDETQTTRLSLEDALQKLSSVEREAFLLVKAEGLTTKEAGQILDVPQGTVKFRVFSAVKKLQTLLREDEGGLPVVVPVSASSEKEAAHL